MWLQVRRWIHSVCETFDYNYADAGGQSQVRTAGANCLFSEDLSNSVVLFFFPNATLPPGVLQALIAHPSVQQASCKSNCHLGTSGIFRFAVPRLRVASVTCSFAKRQFIQVPLEIHSFFFCFLFFYQSWSLSFSRTGY